MPGPRGVNETVLELGGNCPFVICEDAQLDLALEDAQGHLLPELRDGVLEEVDRGEVQVGGLAGD